MEEAAAKEGGKPLSSVDQARSSFDGDDFLAALALGMCPPFVLPDHTF
jgi:hypothetical protein